MKKKQLLVEKVNKNKLTITKCYVGKYKFNTEDEAKMFIKENSSLQSLIKQCKILEKEIQKKCIKNVPVYYNKKVIGNVEIQFNNYVLWDGDAYLETNASVIKKFGNISISGVKVLDQHYIYDAIRYHESIEFYDLFKEQVKRIDSLNKNIKKLSLVSQDIFFQETN